MNEAQVGEVLARVEGADTFLGLKIASSPYIRDGMQIWYRGRDVVAITTKERSEFFAMLGFGPDVPADVARVLVSPMELAALRALANQETDTEKTEGTR
jgi:hypothetical protein